MDDEIFLTDKRYLVHWHGWFDSYGTWLTHRGDHEARLRFTI